jgi:hypothetical protein
VDPSVGRGHFSCSPDLSGLALSLLAERREQNDSAVLRESESDAPSGVSEGEAQLEQTVAQASRQWHPRVASEDGEPIEKHHDPLILNLAECVEPDDDFVKEFDFGHIVIIAFLQ